MILRGGEVDKSKQDKKLWTFFCSRGASMHCLVAVKTQAMPPTRFNFLRWRFLFCWNQPSVKNVSQEV